MMTSEAANLKDELQLAKPSVDLELDEFELFNTLLCLHYLDKTFPHRSCSIMDQSLNFFCLLFSGDYYMKPFISAKPEVTVTERTNKDEFIILASDGLWDVMSNEEACKVARNCLCGHAAAKYPDTVHGSSGSDAAAMLVEFAMLRGSTDNISIVVVELKRLKRWKGGRQNGRT